LYLSDTYLEKGRFRSPGPIPITIREVPLQFRRAAVGSTNPAKVEAVRRTLGRLDPECEVVAIDVPSGIAPTPLGDEAIRAGALARAQAALDRSDAEIGFGLEGGAILDGDRAWLTAHVVALTRDAQVGEAAWGRMLLPRVAAGRMRTGEELGDIVDDLFARKDSKRQTGAVGLLTEGTVSRTDAFADLVAMACAPFLHPELY
jgi:inosine/xanthosine triphosphatase